MKSLQWSQLLFLSLQTNEIDIRFKASIAPIAFDVVWAWLFLFSASKLVIDTCFDATIIEDLKMVLFHNFMSKDILTLCHFLGIEVTWCESSLVINQWIYALSHCGYDINYLKVINEKVSLKLIYFFCAYPFTTRWTLNLSRVPSELYLMWYTYLQAPTLLFRENSIRTQVRLSVNALISFVIASANCRSWEAFQMEKTPYELGDIAMEASLWDR